MNLRKFSQVISRLFDFYFWFPVMLFVTIFNSGLTSGQINILLPVLLFFDVIIHIFLFFLILKSGHVSDLDVTKREERYKLFGGMSLILIIPTVFAYYLGNNLFFVLHLLSLITATTMYTITLKFKISGHMMMNVGAIFILNYLFDFQLLWLFIVVPLVALARVYLKKHTLSEVLAGAVVGFIEPYLILKFFKFL